MKTILLLGVILLLSFSSNASSKEFKDKINDKYSIRLVLPEGYSVKPDPLDDYNVTYWITPDKEDKGAISIMVSTYNVPENMDALKKSVIKSGDFMTKKAVEKTYQVLELKKKNKLLGYYLSTMTDPEAQEQQTKKTMYGQALMNKTLVTFTYQFNDENAKNTEEFLNIVRKMEILPNKP